MPERFPTGGRSRPYPLHLEPATHLGRAVDGRVVVQNERALGEVAVQPDGVEFAQLDDGRVPDGGHARASVKPAIPRQIRRVKTASAPAHSIRPWHALQDPFGKRQAGPFWRRPLWRPTSHSSGLRLELTPSQKEGAEIRTHSLSPELRPAPNQSKGHEVRACVLLLPIVYQHPCQKHKGR